MQVQSLSKRIQRITTIVFLFFSISILVPLKAQPGQTNPERYDSISAKIYKTALEQNKAIGMLSDLCINIGPRLAGSPHAAEAVKWAMKEMDRLGFQNVHTEPVLVPHWIRGSKESGMYFVDHSKKQNNLHLTALGGSIATPKKGITAELVEVKSWDDLNRLRGAVHDKIVFYNRPMDRSLISPGMAYGNAVDQRSRGAIEAAKYGAVAVLVRSMSTRIDDVPHTGQMNYADSIPKIPSAAISTHDANVLSNLFGRGKKIRVSLKLSCDTLPPIESANVIGEIPGSETPNEVIVVGGHLDSWDKGQGAHDDGAGCIQTLEALRLIKELELIPKRTIRAVLFMNEEHGLNGGLAYAGKDRPGEKTIAALECDAGGFSPLGFGVTDSAAQNTLSGYARLFRAIGADHITRGGGGADISPLVKKGVVGIGLIVDGQKYFDYHHSDSDTIDKVNERELALGAAVVAILVYVIAQEGL